MKDHVDCNAAGLPHRWRPRDEQRLRDSTWWECNYCQVSTVTSIGAKVPSNWLGGVTR